METVITIRTYENSLGDWALTSLPTLFRIRPDRCHFMSVGDGLMEDYRQAF